MKDKTNRLFSLNIFWLSGLFGMVRAQKLNNIGVFKYFGKMLLPAYMILIDCNLLNHNFHCGAIRNKCSIDSTEWALPV